jgi:hypothetical protein
MHLYELLSQASSLHVWHSVRSEIAAVYQNSETISLVTQGILLMNISMLLHPEILYDRRGSHIQRAFFRWCSEAMVFIDGRRGIDLNILPEHAQKKLLPWFSGAMGEVFAKQIGVLDNFKKNNGKTFYIPEEFFIALSKVDRGVKLEFLPNNFFAYFAFPKNFAKDPDGDYMNGVYVSCGTPNRSGAGYKNLDMLFVTMREEGGSNKFCEIRMIVKDGDVLTNILPESMKSSAVQVFRDLPVSTQMKAENLISTIVVVANAVLYVHHESDEIIDLKQATNPKKRNGKTVQTPTGPCTNNCSIPIRLLSFSFHEKINFQIDSTEVRGHFRWQPFGPAMNQIKLIWIAAHTRHFAIADSRNFAG